MAVALGTDPFLLTQNNAKDTTAALLGLAPAQLYRGTIEAIIADATPARAQVITLALVLGAYEARITKDAWRRNEYTSGVDTYLHFLRDLGYTLSDVAGSIPAGGTMPTFNWTASIS